MSDELFEKYDKLLNFSQPLSYDDAAQLTRLFSPDCDGLNWAILKAIEEACDTSEVLLSLADNAPARSTRRCCAPALTYPELRKNK